MLISSEIAAVTGLITIWRFVFFYACYRYVLRSVYHDLQTLTGAISKNLNDDSDDELELGTLPVPSTANDGPLLTASPGNSPARQAQRSASGKLAMNHPSVSRFCFSLCFSESCILFLLFLCQETGIFDPKSRILNWRISLFLLLSMILFIVPLLQNFILTYQSSLGQLSRRRSIPTRFILAVIPYSIFLFAFSLIPLPEGFAAAQTDSISSALSRLIVLGTFIIGMLSGLGAARNSWDFMPIFSHSRRKRIPTEQEIRTAEEALERIRNDIVIRRADESRLRSSETNKPTSWMTRVASSITGSSELTSIQQEITGSLALEYQMDRNLEEMRNSLASSRYNETVQGRILRWAGRLFAIYCLFRTLSCIVDILIPFQSSTSVEGSGSSYPDLIAHFLTYLVSLLPFVHLSAEGISAIARQVSLGLVGVIILSSVRFVLRAVSRLLKITSQNLGASLLLLILAQLMGTYLISTLVQLRTAFPPKQADETNVFSTLPTYEVFGATFDYSYLISALATTAYMWFDDRINSGSSRFDDT